MNVNDDQRFGLGNQESACNDALVITLVIFGLQSFSTLPITRVPNVDFPIISVTVTQFGAAPAELESAGYQID